MAPDSYEKLRPVEINGHQIHYKARFHKFGFIDGEAIAIIETYDGNIVIEKAYLLKFLDRDGKEND